MLPTARRIMSAAASSSVQANASSTALRSESLFIAYCPDRPSIFSQSQSHGDSTGDTYARRLSVRQEHWARAQEDKAAGRLFFGLGYLPPPSSPIHSHPLRSPSAQPQTQTTTQTQTQTQTPVPPAMAGSVLIMRQPSLSAMWDRIKADVYWTAGVWDQDHVRVEEFIQHPEYND